MVHAVAVQVEWGGTRYRKERGRVRPVRRQAAGDATARLDEDTRTGPALMN